MKVLRFLLPTLVVAASAWWATHLIRNKPEAERRPSARDVRAVEAVVLRRTDFPVVLRSQGTVEPRTRSELAAEVPGRIVEVSPDFREGGFFEADDVLLTIDPRDYDTAIVIAQGELARAESVLAEEEARAEQAEEDWKRLGGGIPPGDLVLRKPQLTEAQAAVASARARLEDAQVNRERCQVRAPFAGRILEQNVDLGQYVGTGTPVATVYAIDSAEVDLPLTNSQLAHLDLPDEFRGDSAPGDPDTFPKVVLRARVGAGIAAWEGRIVRSSGAVDTESRQLFVTAQVENPYGRRAGGDPPLKVGLFVEAEIHGETLDGVFVIPRSAVQENDYVLAIDKENRLRRKPLEILWGDEASVVVRDGFEDGDMICRTSVPYATDGAPVEPVFETGNPGSRTGEGSPIGGSGAPGLPSRPSTPSAS